MVWLRISPDIDFYLEADIPGVDMKTRELDLQQFDRMVYEKFVERLKKAFPEEDFHIYNFEFGIARERQLKSA